MQLPLTSKNAAGFFERISLEIKMSLWKVLIIFHNDVSLNNSHLRSLFSPNLIAIEGESFDGV